MSSLLRAAHGLWARTASISSSSSSSTRFFTQIPQAIIPTLAHPPSSPAPLASQSSVSPIKRALDHLRSQPQHYAIVDLLGRSYLVTRNDIVVLSRANDLRVGDSLRLDRVREVGSKDYTLKGAPLLNPAHCSVKATVIEHPSSSQITITKFKKRKNYHRRYLFKHRHTLLRISDISLGS
ncbi:MAG: ribosomal protein L21-like protein [Piptocephalis tieghemiana]|nr:MAG: ribosomal protein L21-like protein [Piptocephalis tieghemiana]